MHTKWKALLSMLLMISAFGVLQYDNLQNLLFPPSYTVEKQKAYNYLQTHFNSSVGLIYESEDQGTQIIAERNYSYNQIYWIYSDNLLATWALKQYNPTISNRINQTIHSYIQSYNITQSNFFEVLFGTPIPENFWTAVPLVLENHSDKIILTEIHNSTTELNWTEYSDTLIYQALNMYLKGNRTGAEDYFNKAHKKWNGTAIVDFAMQKNATQEGRYANYKLALILYASKVLNIPIKNYRQIEEKMWSMQQENGGITSLAELKGNPDGSANTETTAMVLLLYNDELISRMRSIQTD